MPTLWSPAAPLGDGWPQRGRFPRRAGRRRLERADVRAYPPVAAHAAGAVKTWRRGTRDDGSPHPPIAVDVAATVKEAGGASGGAGHDEDEDSCSGTKPRARHGTAVSAKPTGNQYAHWGNAVGIHTGGERCKTVAESKDARDAREHAAAVPRRFRGGGSPPKGIPATACSERPRCGAASL